jgi:transposase
MLSLPSTVRVFVATAPCDLRKQFAGIALLVEQGLYHDPRSGHRFVVFNRRGDQVRILIEGHLSPIARHRTIQHQSRPPDTRAGQLADLS